jgi:hypothetical protein
MKYGRRVRNIALIVASGFILSFCAGGETEAPPQLLRKIAQREAESARARDSYTYRQTVTVQELDAHGLATGAYREIRDVTFSPEKGRYESLLHPPQNTLKHLKMTAEDFEDIRNVQPFLLTTDQVPLYHLTFKGDEEMDGYPCYVASLEPKQILSGQRFFEGLLWIRQSDFAVVRSEGQAVPQIESLKEQNLFPHFTTLRREIDGKWFFPVETYADDTLYFRSGPQRIRVTIRYADYKRFGADSEIQFGQPVQK